MKKKFIFLNLLLALFITGCSSADVDNVMTSISNGIETGVNNVSDMIEKMKGDTPSTIKLPMPPGNNFKFENYKMSLKYIEKTGIEVSLNGKLYNQTGRMLIVVTEFPIYDLNGREVSRGYLKNYIDKNSVGQLYGNYSQYKLKRDLRIVPENVMTRIYSNGTLISSTHRVNISSSKGKTSVPKKVVEEKKEVKVVNEQVKTEETGISTRQSRQRIAK